MQKLQRNLAKFRHLIIEVYGFNNLINGNFGRYSNQPKAFDIDIIALVFTSKSMQINS